MKFDAVAFDLDGTLYPNYRFYLRLIPFIAKEHRLLWAMGRARDLMREAAPTCRREVNFYETQAALMAEILKSNPCTVRESTDRLIYRGWEPIFRNVRLFPDVRESFSKFRAAGLKLGLLSDFPPRIKLEYLGIPDGWDTVLCSEETGHLKPDPAPFLALAQGLGVAPDRILYVGNSVRYDVVGASGVGMKTALISRGKRATAGADFVFSNYRQLQRFVLT